MQTRRQFILTLALSVIGVSAIAYFKSPVYNMNENEELKKRAQKIHSNIVTLDSHCDTPLNLFYQNINLAQRHDAHKSGTKFDYPRMKEGSLDATFFAVFIGQSRRDAASNQQAKETALKFFDAIHKSIKDSSDLVEAAVNYDDVERIKKTGKRAVYTCIENGYPIGTDLDNVEEFYRLGARYITLCHSSNNDICDSSTDEGGAEHNGLSAFGKKVIKEMNRLGMIVDVSHVSDKSFYDVVELSKTPIIASHSAARAICSHPRNMDDKMLKTLTDKGGVIQLCLVSKYITEQPENPDRIKADEAMKKKYNNYQDMNDNQWASATIEWRKLQQELPDKSATVLDAVDHIDHIVKVAGIDHVGIGTDFDGGGGIEGFFDVCEACNLTYELVKRGYSKQDIEKIWGGNFLRVFKQVQELSQA